MMMSGMMDDDLEAEVKKVERTTNHDVKAAGELSIHS